MTGFGVDPDALRGAVNKLKDLHQTAMDLGRDSSLVQPGELTANDASTSHARQVLLARASGNAGSLRQTARDLADRLKEKIDAYEATLREYEAAEEHATVSGRQVDHQA